MSFYDPYFKLLTLNKLRKTEDEFSRGTLTWVSNTKHQSNKVDQTKVAYQQRHCGQRWALRSEDLLPAAAAS